jgi:chromosome condensin MukBEF MukE localization factor
MFPLTYEEFLMSINPKLYKFYESINIENIKAIDNFIHNELLETFYLYLAI